MGKADAASDERGQLILKGFEYLSVFFSVVVGLAVTQIMSGIATLVEARGRVKYDWIHMMWVANILLMDVQVWWGMWELQEYQGWRFRTFMLTASVPATLYLLSRLLAPQDITTTQHVDMRDHFESIRPVFFTLILLYVIFGIIGNVVLFYTPVLSPTTYIPAGIGVLAACCLRSANRTLHGAYAVLTFAGMLMFIAFDTQVMG